MEVYSIVSLSIKRGSTVLTTGKLPTVLHGTLLWIPQV